MDLNLQSSIHLWILDAEGFDLEVLEPRSLALLSSAESERYRRYTLPRAKRQLLLSRTLLHSVLTHYVNDAPLVFRLGDHGRPELASESIAPDSGAGSARGALSFNLSHSRDRLVVAVTRAGFVGVDVEYAARRRRVERLISRYFSEAEQAALLALPVAQRQARFYTLWSLKEAYVKARGLGLALPLADFSFSLSGQDVTEERASTSLSFSGSLANESAESWRFWRSPLAGEDYAFGLALQACRTKDISLTVRESCARRGLEGWEEVAGY